MAQWNNIDLSNLNLGQIGDYFGTSVNMSHDGTVFAVGVSKPSGGYVKVYEYSEGTWGLLITLYGDTIDDSLDPEFFGEDVSVSSGGETIVVSSSGAAFIYRRNGNNYADAPFSITDKDQYFGKSTAINQDGNRVAVTHASAGNSNIYFYDLDDSGNWDEHTLVGNNPEGFSFTGVNSDGDQINISLDNSGEKLAVGIPDVGAGVVDTFFNESGITWTNEHITGALSTKSYGLSVILSGNGDYLFVRALSNDDNNTRLIHIINVATDGQVEATIIGNNNDSNGPPPYKTVATDYEGTILIVGSYHDADNKLLIYTREGDNWLGSETATELNGLDSGTRSDYLGASVSLVRDYDPVVNALVTGVPEFNEDDSGDPEGTFELFEFSFQGSGFGDPHIVPIETRKEFTLPHDVNKSFLLFDNNDQENRLIVKGFTYKPADFKHFKQYNKMTYFKYFKFEYNNKSFIIDAETLQFKKYEQNKLTEYKLENANEPNISNVFIKKNNKLPFNIKQNRKIETESSVGLQILFSVMNIKFLLVADVLGRELLRSNIRMQIPRKNDNYDGALYKKVIKEVDF